MRGLYRSVYGAKPVVVIYKNSIGICYVPNYYGDF